MGTNTSALNGYVVDKGEIGSVIVGYRNGRVAAVLLGDDVADVVRQLGARFSDIAARGPCDDGHGVARKVAAYMDGEDWTFDAQTEVSGTSFQKTVWRAIQSIPRGRTETYAQIAAKIGRPKAVRAVASACAANPIAILVPCHRVVRSDRKASGYAWGMDRKSAILASEGLDKA
ncbi:methylated-DNA--[protein]-cysteine S-methyltransferase [Rhizobium sp. BK176]|uniref:methylated-DNA--[protein]-cysteine S-methyltransferase n=1 Tax=Rhizobium sp. BK176 TaxID=2587071 RepID=UPI002169715A|nr:methylated-DNA--[protein]-cysteine S-methyltransferase [Rhizobium sp. BK176]MCS4088591.1 AraC family transcriptional regulator of adaptative response/methylated-DNA-[protein]-cysteine methyltransferase [Rhizobium sp. BK176]